MRHAQAARSNDHRQSTAREGAGPLRGGLACQKSRGGTANTSPMVSRGLRPCPALPVRRNPPYSYERAFLEWRADRETAPPSAHGGWHRVAQRPRRRHSKLLPSALPDTVPPGAGVCSRGVLLHTMRAVHHVLPALQATCLRCPERPGVCCVHHRLCLRHALRPARDAGSGLHWRGDSGPLHPRSQPTAIGFVHAPRTPLCVALRGGRGEWPRLVIGAGILLHSFPRRQSHEHALRVRDVSCLDGHNERSRHRWRPL